MKLLLDLGNTRLKWAWQVDGELVGHGSGPAGDAPGAVADLPAPHGPPRAVLLASVADPSATERLMRALDHRWAVPMRLAHTEAAGCGVRNGYARPDQMGVDRWLAMVAAFARFGGPVCVVDAGTALTVDVVAADGTHAGGLILPGRTLMHRALLRDTGRIAAAAELANAPAGPPAGLGTDTESCIRAAALRAARCLVEDCLRSPPMVPGGVLVLAGGDAPVLRQVLTVPSEYCPALVLEGLALRLGGAPEAATSS